MKKQLFLGAVAAIALTGCTAINTSGAAATPNVEVTKTYAADITASNKAVTGEASVQCLFGVITWGVSNYADGAFKSSGSGLCLASANTVAEQGAVYNALDAAKADMLLAAKYQIDTKDYFVYKTVKCTVTGYPATIKGVK